MSEQTNAPDQQASVAGANPSDAPTSDAAASTTPASAADSSAAPASSSAAAAGSSQAATSEAASTASSAPQEGHSTVSGAASPNSTTADLSHLTQTVGGGSSAEPKASDASGAGTSRAAASEPASPQSSQDVSAAASPSATGAKAHKSSSHRSKPSSAQSKSSPSPTRTQSAGNKSRKRLKLGELDLATAKIGFLGAGRMAESTINGLINYARVAPGRIHVAAPSSKGLERFKALGCRVTKRNYDIFGRYDCDIIFLCFHGYVIKHCYKLGGARPHPLTTNYIPHQRHPIYILSLVSGVSLSQIKACLLNPESANRYVVEIHRIMMNTAVGHGLGICAVDCEPDSRKLSAPLRQLLSSIAHLEHVPASQMDAACAVGGSGLAFSYYFINALADGAFKMGLSRQQAIRFASKTAQCAAQTMLESGKHPAELRDNVSAQAGAAIYGVHVLEKNDVASGVTAAVEAAHKRASDLATQEIS